MSQRTTTSGRSWAPWTFKGVADFANRPFKRLAVMQVIVVLIAAAVTMVFVALAWIPAIDQAVDRLPSTGVIRQSRLHWQGMLPQSLTDSPFLGIVIVDRGNTEVGQVADLQLELAPERWKLRSLLGYLDFKYPAGYRVDLSRKDLEPWWGARRHLFVAGAGVAMLVGMPVIWAILGVLYVPVTKLVGLYGNRELPFWNAWKLNVAALMPGALLMSVLILLYGFHRLSLAAFLGGVGLHVLVGWLYVVVAPWSLARRGSRAGAVVNPFSRNRDKKARKQEPG